MIASLRCALVAVVVLAGCTQARSSATVLRTDADTPPMLVVVVRHAEKAPLPADDPVLSAAGIARAASLDSALRRLPVTDVVVTHLQRTRLTAAAFIARTNAIVHVIPIAGGAIADHIAAIADTVRAISQQRGRGGVLVVGHSNTVTQIVAALGGGENQPLCDSQYARLFVLKEQSSGIVVTERSTYGAPDPLDASCASGTAAVPPRR